MNSLAALVPVSIVSEAAAAFSAIAVSDYGKQGGREDLAEDLEDKENESHRNVKERIEH